MQIQQEKKEKEITDIIQTMIDEQKRLLNEGLDISKDGDIVKVKKEWNDDILTDGGISYYRLNDKWYNGETLNLIAWAERTGINEATISSRLKMGWSVHDALNKPVMKRKNNIQDRKTN